MSNVENAVRFTQVIPSETPKLRNSETPKLRPLASGLWPLASETSSSGLWPPASVLSVVESYSKFFHKWRD